jgi:site-specific DNA-methyltransferase (adenine-specific)
MENKLFHGDCLKIMADLPPQSVDLAFADPPFNIDYQYDEYEDNLHPVEYIAWCSEWMRAVRRLLKPHGAFWIASHLRYQARLQIAAEDVGMLWRNTIASYFTFGACQRKNFTPSWVALHYFTMDKKKFTFDRDAIAVPSARTLLYNDPRARKNGKSPDNVWILAPSLYDSCFQPHENAWIASRVCGTFRERTAHPAQMPEAILDRVVLACSNPGDMVFDPFAGSGTTLAVAKKRGRRWCGTELSGQYCEIIEKRLAEIEVKSPCFIAVDAAAKPGLARRLGHSSTVEQQSPNATDS